MVLFKSFGGGVYVWCVYACSHLCGRESEQAYVYIITCRGQKLITGVFSHVSPCILRLK